MNLRAKEQAEWIDEQSYRKRRSLTRLIDKLVDAAIIESSIYRKGKPGERIAQLSEEDRKLIQRSTAKDFTWPGPR